MPELTLVDSWRATADRLGDRPLVFHFDDTVTARSVRDQANALANHFQALGLKPDERVAVCLQNDPQWLTTLLGAWEAGLVVVPLNPMIRQNELNHYLQDSGARLLVTSADYLADVANDVVGALNLVEVLVADAVQLENDTIGTVPVRAMEDVLAANIGAPDVRIPRAGSDVALLTYTSGTTGPPKGAMNTHANLRHSAEVLTQWYGLEQDDVIWGIAPFFHITGLTTELALTIHTGAPLIMFHRFDASTALRLAEKWHATFCVGAITAYLAMLADPSLTERDLHALTKVFTGGAPVSPATVDRFLAETGIYIHNGYGLTESTGPATFTPRGMKAPVDPTSGALSVGVPLPGMSITLVDPKTREALGPGEPGEIVLSGPLIVAGYWDKKEETENAMPDGRLHTGDIGFVDRDGYLFIVDRAKDQINASGFKVWPREVEDVLFQHPVVQEAAVVGRPDPYRGETVAAYVVPRAGESVSAAELTQFCAERLAAYKRPRSFEFVDELPKTLTGKVLRRTLRDVSTGDNR